MRSIACCSRGGRRDTALEPVHIDDGRRGQHLPGADLSAAVSHGRHRLRRCRVRPVQVAAVDERNHAGAGRGRLRHRHLRQPPRGVRRFQRGGRRGHHRGHQHGHRHDRCLRHRNGHRRGHHRSHRHRHRRHQRYVVRGGQLNIPLQYDVTVAQRYSQHRRRDRGGRRLSGFRV